MRPESVAIVGMSSKPNTMSHALLRNLLLNEFTGDIHLVGRSGGEIDGRRVHSGADELPDGVDVAILAVPAAAVGDALETCVARKVGAAVVFASGFAEVGENERSEQERIGRLARDGGVAVIGPNCIGYTNFRDGFTVTFANVYRIAPLAADTRNAVAVVAQSGGLGGHLRLAVETRGVPVSYNVTTGNEMGLDLADFVGFLVDDEATRVIMVYAEHIRRPAAFLDAARRARAAGKVVVMMHSGRGTRSQEAARSHTGALAGDYGVMRVAVERAGVLFVDTLDELLDVTEIAARYPSPVRGGLGVMTLSGAFCSIAHDFCESIDVPLPLLSPATEAHLKALLPAFTPPRNPLDLGTQPIWQPELLRIGLQALLEDDAIGGVAVSITAGAAPQANAFLKHIVAGRVNDKPLALAILGDGAPLPAEFLETVRAKELVLSRSSDRTLRAMGAVVKWANRAPAPAATVARVFPAIPKLGPGPQPEWLGKLVLAAAGVAVPPGQLARTPDEAVAVATKIGFPVALKAQAAVLAHKTEAGGVLLGCADPCQVRDGWLKLHANVERAQPGLVLDGVLVEAMAASGRELVVGARRDPQWGPILLVGLGGIFVEALNDVRLLAADASHDEVLTELRKLASAKLLAGFRGMPPADVDAVAVAAVALGRLMLAHPEIVEIDVNPLVVHPRGEGATALDALIVTVLDERGERNAG